MTVLRYLHTACLLTLLCLAGQKAYAQVPRYAIAAVPHPVYDYKLPHTEFQRYDPRLTIDSFKIGSIDAFRSSYYWYEDQGNHTATAYWGRHIYAHQDTLLPYHAEIATDSVNCINYGPARFATGDTIDASDGPWRSNSLLISNQDMQNCTNAGIAYGVRFIYPLAGGGMDTIYGYWLPLIEEIHMTMDTLSMYVGMEDQDAPAAFQSWPVPATERLHLRWHPSLGILRFMVMDLTGRVLQERWVRQGAMTCEVDLQGLPAGIYLIRAQDAKGRSSTQRFLKQ